MVEASACCVCQKSKPTLVCGACESPVCKSCAQFLDDESFSFLKKVPTELSHTTYCGPCYDQKVAPELEIYEQDMEKAKQIFVFLKKQGKETRLIRRSENPFQVLNCPDPEETLLRLAFFSVKAGFNAVIDVDITSVKVKNGSYQKLSWSGTGVPAQVDAAKMNRKSKL